MKALFVDTEEAGPHFAVSEVAAWLHRSWKRIPISIEAAVMTACQFACRHDA
ncbi:hypothetical protein OHQ88_34220 (plasmid) [Micromonospora zamorensis]|uniref:hypothetical protein n=1 Tax=Micromonospora zamorensis TaxID=709883 RepID=UPI002E1A07AE